jgi:WD40 repeat protein
MVAFIHYVNLIACATWMAADGVQPPQMPIAERIAWKTLQISDSIRSPATLSVNPQSSTLVTAGESTIVRWDLDAPTNRRILIDESGGLCSSVISKNGLLFATGNWITTSNGEYGVITLRDFDSGSIKWTKKAHDSCISCIDFSPNGNHIATGSWDETVKIWDVNSGKLIQTLVSHRHSIHGVQFSPSGEYLVSVSADGYVILWSTANRYRQKSIFGNPKDRLYSLSISSNGKWLAAGDDKGVIHVWNLQQLTLAGNIKAHDEPITSLSFNKNSTLLTSATRNNSFIRTYDMDTRSIVTSVSLKVIDDNVGINFIQFANEHNHLLYGRSDGEIGVLNVSSGEKRLILKNKGSSSSIAR